MPVRIVHRLPRRKPAPLISHDTILILSVFLMGMVLGRIVEGDWQRIAFMASAIGLVSYLGLRQLVRSHHGRSRRIARERAAKMLSHKLDRHVPRYRPAHGSLRVDRKSPISIEQQYLTVVTSNRAPRR